MVYFPKMLSFLLILPVQVKMELAKAVYTYIISANMCPSCSEVNTQHRLYACMLWYSLYYVLVVMLDTPSDRK
jgi:hypothetical protein